MPKPLFIVVTGPPGVGKTFLSCEIARRLKLYCIHRDDIKELLYDAFGFGDFGWSKKLGAVSFALMNFYIEDLMDNGISFIAEANFRGDYQDIVIKEFKKKFGYNMIQIYCTASDRVLFDRYNDRYDRGHRHIAHFYHYDSLEDFRENVLKGKEHKLRMPGKTIKVDMNDYSKIDYNKLEQKIRKIIKSFNKENGLVLSTKKPRLRQRRSGNKVRRR